MQYCMGGGKMTGLNITENEFCKLSIKDRDLLLYKNQVLALKQSDDILKLIKGYKLNQKIQYFLISFCIAGIGLIARYMILK